MDPHIQQASEHAHRQIQAAFAVLSAVLWDQERHRSLHHKLMDDASCLSFHLSAALSNLQTTTTASTSVYIKEIFQRVTDAWSLKFVHQ